MSKVMLGYAPEYTFASNVEYSASNPVLSVESPYRADIAQSPNPMPVYTSPIVSQSYVPIDKQSDVVVLTDRSMKDKIVNIDTATTGGENVTTGEGDVVETGGDTGGDTGSDLKEGFKIAAPIVLLGAAAIYFFFFRKK